MVKTDKLPNPDGMTLEEKVNVLYEHMIKFEESLDVRLEKIEKKESEKT